MIVEPRKEGFHIVLTTHNSRRSQRMIKYEVKKGMPRLLNLEEEIALTKIIGETIQENAFKCTAYNICKDHVHMILVCKREELSRIVGVIKGKSSYLFNRRDEGCPSNEFQPIDTPKAERIGKKERYVQSDDKGMNPLGADPSTVVDTHQNPSNGLQPIENENYIDDDNGINPLGVEKCSEKKKYGPLWSQKFFRADLDIWHLAKLDARPGYLYLSGHLNNATHYIRTNRQKHKLPSSNELQVIMNSFVITEEKAFMNIT